MATATPTGFDDSQKRSSSKTRSHTPPPRPTTPLRPPSRSSFRASQTPTRGGDDVNLLDSLEPTFAELADGMADLEANFMHLQLMHESLSRFNECFASFLHGLKVNAFCVDFPEAPIPESFRRAKDNPRFNQPPDESSFNRSVNSEPGQDVDQTFLTTDTSFVENPPASSAKASTTSQFSTPAARGRGTANAGRAGRGSGVPRARGAAGTASGRGRASGLARATNRGRGVQR